MMTLAMIALVQNSVGSPDGLTVGMPLRVLVAAESISSIVLTLVVLGALIALFSVLMQLRSLTRSVGEVAGRLRKDAGPVLERARSVAENVDFITTAVRTDVQKLNASVSRLNDRLKEASERMEERIQDFTALVEVLQSEAEDLALDTAAVVRGVRAGTRSLSQGDEGLAGEEDPEALALLSPDEEQ